LIDFTDGGCITDIICACLAFIVLITTDGGLVSIDTDPNVVIVDSISFIYTLEQNILQDLDDTEDKIKSKINILLKQLSKNSKTVEGLQSDIIAVKEYASDLQAFLGSKVIEEEVIMYRHH
jgi:low affinity Fe/Cu permease